MRVAFVSQGPVYEGSTLPFRLLTGYAMLDPLIASRVDFVSFALRPFSQECDAQAQALALAERLVEQDVDLLALSLYCWNSQDLLAVAHYAKVLKPNLVVVAGGPDTYGEARALIACHPAIDFVIEREGELPFRRLLAALLDTPASDVVLDTVPFAAARRECRAVESPNREVLACLDDIPSPVLGRRREELLSRNYDEDRWIALFESSRGCVVNCAYCQYSKAGAGAVRAYSLERVLSELAYLTTLGVKDVYFTDSVFTLNPSRARAVLDHFLDEAPDARLHVEIKLDMLPAALVDRCKALFAQQRLHFGVGVQTVNERTLAAMGRGSRFDKLAENLRKLRGDGLIPLRWDLIFGLPGDTLQDVLEGLDFIVGHDPGAEVSLMQLHVLPGTELRARAEAYGLVYAHRPPYYVLRSTTWTRKEMHRASLISDLIGEYGAALWLAFRRNVGAIDPDAPFRNLFDESLLAAIDQAAWCDPKLQLAFIDRVKELVRQSHAPPANKTLISEAFEYLFLSRNAGNPALQTLVSDFECYRPGPGRVEAVRDDLVVSQCTVIEGSTGFSFVYPVREWLEERGYYSAVDDRVLEEDPNWVLVYDGSLLSLPQYAYDLLSKLAGQMTVEQTYEALVTEDSAWGDVPLEEVRAFVATLLESRLVAARGVGLGRTARSDAGAGAIV